MAGIRVTAPAKVSSVSVIMFADNTVSILVRMPCSELGLSC